MPINQKRTSSSARKSRYAKNTSKPYRVNGVNPNHVKYYDMLHCKK